MSDSENVPSWVDPMLARFLPGGPRLEADLTAGHSTLAVCIYKWADGSLEHQATCEDGEGCRTLSLEEKTFSGKGGFAGSLEIHLAASGATEFRVHGNADQVFTLPIAHPGRFATLLVELTQPLESIAASEFEGPSWVDPRLADVLPGGDRWPDDSQEGHPSLAARIHRLATDYLGAGETSRDETGVVQCDSVPMAGAVSLNIRRWKSGAHYLPSVDADIDGWRFVLASPAPTPTPRPPTRNWSWRSRTPSASGGWSER